LATPFSFVKCANEFDSLKTLQLLINSVTACRIFDLCHAGLRSNLPTPYSGNMIQASQTDSQQHIVRIPNTSERHMRQREPWSMNSNGSVWFGSKSQGFSNWFVSENTLNRRTVFIFVSRRQWSTFRPIAFTWISRIKISGTNSIRWGPKW
jgi:hypothetical protein